MFKNNTYGNTEIFVPMFYTGKCVKVYDGDTITVVAIPMQCENKVKPYRFTLRLAGIDTPELKTHEPKAQEAKEFLSNKILDKIIDIDLKGYGKYGRLIAKISIDNECLNSALLDLGLASPYKM